MARAFRVVALVTVPAALRFVFLFSFVLMAAARGREFDFHRDTFAFSNDTVLRYGVDETGRLHISRRDKPVEFSHRCFVLVRAVLQFHKFARFAPDQPRVSREEYREIVKRISRIPVWRSAAREPIAVPGYRDLRSFSVAYEGLLKENLGKWWPSYLRFGNWRMATGHLRGGQAAAARWLVDSLERGEPRALYLARFPHMNHVVIAYQLQRKANGALRFSVYDPNYPDEPSWLDYLPAERSFAFQKRWYFPGGRVNVMRVFISPWH